ncbi:DUF4345 domain-containing protein [Pseudohalocynthiibacter aestuariivivens]|jgi:predicted anti-sigma-YlaC factor YlaD|uniref:DUF4345 domain-containing protein n=1 Tax=Pseudohalocynthiibacter aestuariivivens TaxID=1591409 RepID=A0ABV5JC99_9RHOB|nr:MULTISPECIES: DUF4345 domain-containing protein [Pseudohalocynthiibacter]MBS9719006.1 DUF4345 domain-containing protein [Pseudohalocynthiibacter aestuariivivens]MCK0104604.1 DUF4345 domain-containing protein [Pseudohalocynthiibacter sp. F2068]
MSLTRLEKITLGISGLTAVGIGGFIMVAPHAFYASYGITLGNDASLLSELRAPAAGLVTLGVLMIAGIWRTAMAQLAVASALIVFLAFPAGRLIGLAVDGMPSGGIIGALVLEITIAILCIIVFRRRFLRATPGLTDVPALS